MTYEIRVRNRQTNELIGVLNKKPIVSFRQAKMAIRMAQCSLPKSLFRITLAKEERNVR